MYLSAKKKGFSLIELLIYVALSSMLLIIVLTLYFALAEARLRQQSIAEVETQGLSVMQLILGATRSIYSITSPTQGGSATSLTLSPYATSSKPIVFDVVSGMIRESDGGGTPIPLTSTQVVVSNLTFLNAGRAGTLGSIKITFTMAHATTSKYGSQYAKTFYGSATVRRTPQ